MNASKELIKQIAVWLGIVALLPLAVWYGVNLVSPPPDQKARARYDRDHPEQMGQVHVTETTTTVETKDAAAQEKTLAKQKQMQEERKRIEEERDEEDRVYYRAMFLAACPVGLLALVIGIFFPVQSVGSGLMFGGLSALGAGCYSYWDKMDPGLRFGSLIVTLLLLLVLGTLRFWRTHPIGLPPAPHRAG